MVEREVDDSVHLAGAVEVARSGLGGEGIPAIRRAQAVPDLAQQRDGLIAAVDDIEEGDAVELLPGQVLVLGIFECVPRPLSNLHRE